MGLVPAVLEKPESPPRFATFGTSHVKLWRLDRFSSALESRRGAFGPEGAPAMVTAAAWTQKGNLIVGGDAGEIVFFREAQAVRRLRCQPSALALLLPMRDALMAIHANGTCVLQRDDKSLELDL